MKIIINDNNLKENEINEFSFKVRSILVNENNEILVCNYGGTYLLPGGKIDEGESQISALIRELKEETGILYDKNDLSFLCELQYYQKNYPKRDSNIKLNRLVSTYYYFGNYKNVNLDKQVLSNKEIKSNFKLELIKLDDLENIVLNNHNSNPRNSYFQKELITVLENYKSRK